METESLFEMYENIIQIKNLSTYFHINGYNVDFNKCLEFLTLLEYHKQLFNSDVDFWEYENITFKPILRRRSVGMIASNIFDLNTDREFPEEIYKKYSKFTNWKIRYYIAKNSHTPKYILEDLLSDKHDDEVVNYEAKFQLRTRF